MNEFDFSSQMESICKFLLGDENPNLSKPGVELRFGNNGSISVNLKKGTFFDNEEKEGGGVLDLIYKQTGKRSGEAIQWLRDNGFDAPQKIQNNQSQKRKIVKTYDYKNLDDQLVFQVCRWEPKTFTQRRPFNEEEGVFINGLNSSEYMRKNGGNWSRYNQKNYEKWGCTEKRNFGDLNFFPIYNSKQVDWAIKNGQEIFYTEGEKDADRIIAAGYPATTNAGGAGKWRDDYAEQLKDAHIVLVSDNDEAGKNHVQNIGRNLKPFAASIKILDIAKIWKNCPQKGDISDWADSGGDIDNLGDISQKNSEEWYQEPLVSTMNAVNFGDITSMTSPHEPLIKRFLTRKEIAVLYAESGMGKSFLSLEIACAVALGRDYRGMKTRQGLVVYQAGEGGAGVQRRIAAYKQHNAIYENIPAVLIPTRINLMEEESVNSFIKEIKTHQQNYLDHELELVVIDTWAKATLGANEISAQDVTKALKGVEKIQSECNTAVLLVHHTNASGERMKGNSVLPAAVETTITITDTERREEAESEYGNPTVRKIRRAFVVKQKEGESGNGFNFVLKQVKLGEDEEGDPITSCICAAPENENTNPDHKKLSPQQHIAMEALVKALSSNGEPIPNGMQIESGVTKIVRMGYWKSFFDEMTFIDDEDETKKQERIKKSLQRAGETFMQKGYIGRTKPYVYLTYKEIPGFKSVDLVEAREVNGFNHEFDNSYGDIPF